MCIKAIQWIREKIYREISIQMILESLILLKDLPTTKISALDVFDFNDPVTNGNFFVSTLYQIG